MRKPLILLLTASVAMLSSHPAVADSPDALIVERTPRADDDYVSALDDYRRMQQEPHSPTETWIEMNDEAGRLGGHAGQIGFHEEAAVARGGREER